MHSAYIKERPGTTKAVLMVHGICSTPRHFDWLLPEFDESWSVYNILLDGHGGSVQDFSHTSMKKWKAQTGQLLDMLCSRYETVLLVGYSMGTLLHIYNMPGHPQVKGVILLNTPMRPWVKWHMFRRFLRFTGGKIWTEDPHEVACMADIGIRMEGKKWHYLGWIPRFLELLQICRYGRHHGDNVQVPCYAYFGKKDELVRVCSARYFRKNPYVVCRIFDSAGHFWFSPEDRETVLQDLRQMVKAAEEKGAKI